MSGNGDIPNPEAWVAAPVLSGGVRVGGSFIDLKWLVGNDKEYANLASYTLFRAQDNGPFTLNQTLTPTTFAYSDSSMLRGHDYSYYISATWPDGTQISSNRITIPGFVVDIYAPGSYVWPKRPNLVVAQGVAIGSGGGGASAGCQSGVGNGFISGGGGSGAGYAASLLAASDLAATEAVVVGASGQGGAAVSSLGTGVGLAGTDGATSSFGTLLVATGGQAGQPDGTTHPAGGAGTVTAGTSQTTDTGGSGGLGDDSNVGRTTPHPGTGATFAGGGGGGGGFLTAFNSATTNAGAGGASGTAAAGTAGITAVGVSGNVFAGVGGPGNPQVGVLAGAGGGGGGAAGGGPAPGTGVPFAGAGGAGGGYGGGGGGGGAAQSGGQLGDILATAGAGGSGGPGVVEIVTYYW